MARRGFFAELQHQSRQAANERERQEKQAIKNHLSMVRHAEQAKKAEDRAVAQLAKATDAERKLLEKAAREAHIAAMEAEVLQRNGNLAAVYEEIDSLLLSTLDVDDYVDLNSLRVVAKHPSFDRSDLEKPLPPPAPITDPPKPVLNLPAPPSGLFSFFSKKKHDEAVEQARRTHEQALVSWTTKCQYFESSRQAAEKARAQQDLHRVEKLRIERERYAGECAQRVAEAAKSNQVLDELIVSLGYGTVEAVQEYVSIVLSNSVYPEHFKVSHEFEFDPATAELRLQVLIPAPSEISNIKSYKYTKSSDEITSTDLSQKECRERYAGAVHQVALRSLHEVFESDRRGLIHTIALEVGTNAVDPATGQKLYVSFVIAGAERATFLAFDLSSVVPHLTLAKLGAAVSKNPYALETAERAGVRRS